MENHEDVPKLHQQALLAVKSLAILLLMSAAVGSASAFFLWSLDSLTLIRFSHPWLLWFLPLGGFAIGWLYLHYGKIANGGNNLLIDEIHQPGAGVPRRIVPLILLGTLVTHLFGGSAGREGTAVQMGGGIAATFSRIFRLPPASIRWMLMAGVAAGFGSVFGTPIAGAIFALEVLVIGRVQYDALLPCFLASLVANWVCTAWGITHTHYHVNIPPHGSVTDFLLFGKVLLAAAAFGLAGRLFSWSSHKLSLGFQKIIPRPEFRPVLGGLLIIGLYFLVKTPDYLGLGVLPSAPDSITLPAIFTSTPIPATAWLWKLIFTVITLSSGFKGGEVTPLFFIGAALGNSLAVALGAPTDLLAALGFVAIFAAATNTPLASTILGIELFGSENSLYIAIACIIAYTLSGHKGIYPAQRLAIPKLSLTLTSPLPADISDQTVPPKNN